MPGCSTLPSIACQPGAESHLQAGIINDTIVMCLCRCECERGIKVHTRVTPERTSSKEIRLCPSLRSSYRSVMCFLT